MRNITQQNKLQGGDSKPVVRYRQLRRGDRGGMLPRRSGGSPRQRSGSGSEGSESGTAMGCGSRIRRCRTQKSTDSWNSRLSITIRQLSTEHSAQVLPHKYYWEWIEKQGELRDPITERLLDAVNNENEQELENILRSEAHNIENIRNADIRGCTLLHYASSRDNAAVVEVLLRYGFDVNRKSTQPLDLYLESFDYVSKFRAGSTPIYIATVAGLPSVASVLAKSGANPNIQDVEGYTPMHNAAWHNKIELIRQLLSFGAKINVQDITGSTPLRKAAYKGQADAVKHLLTNGADPNIRTKRGRAPIHCAALYGHTEVLSLLITHGAKVNIQDNDDVTPLHAAVYNGKRLAVRVLLKSNADVEKETKFGNTALHLACMEKWLVIASLLVQAGSNYESKNRFGETPASIMDTGNAGKRINLFSQEGIPSLSELERMEAEHKERGMSIPAVSAAAKQMATNGQTVYQTGQHSLDGDSIQSYSNVGSEQKKERRRRREEKI